MGNSGLTVAFFQSSEKMYHEAPNFAALLSALPVDEVWSWGKASS